MIAETTTPRKKPKTAKRKRKAATKRIPVKPANEYDAITDKKRRRTTSGTLYHEDRLLDQTGRKRMLNNSRDLYRNAPDAGWAIRKHLDFVSQFNFQCRTPDETYNTNLEYFVTRVLGEPAAFEIAARHSINPFFRLAEASKVIDGDVFALKLADGRLQAIEGDRIRTAGKTRDLPDWYKPADFDHGIKSSKAGRVQWYCVNNRSGSSFRFGRLYPARWMIPHGSFHRFDQIRGVTPLSAALNSFRDLYEGRVYALMKMKVAQLFGMAITRESDDPLASYESTEAADGDTEDSAGNDPSKYDALMVKPHWIMQFDPGDEVKFLSNSFAADDIAKLDQLIIGSALKSLDIPLSFYHEDLTNFFGSKQAERLYLFSAIQKREAHKRLRNAWLQWRLGIAVATGDVTLPRGMDFDALYRACEWVPEGLPWWRPLEEVKSTIEAIMSGQTSTPEATKERGKDAYQIARDQAKYDLYVKELREGLNLPPEPGSGATPNVPFETIADQERRANQGRSIATV